MRTSSQKCPEVPGSASVRDPSTPSKARVQPATSVAAAAPPAPPAPQQRTFVSTVTMGPRVDVWHAPVQGDDCARSYRAAAFAGDGATRLPARSETRAGHYVLGSRDARPVRGAPKGWRGRAGVAELVTRAHGAAFEMTVVRGCCGATYDGSMAENAESTVFVYLLHGAATVCGVALAPGWYACARSTLLQIRVEADDSALLTITRGGAMDGAPAVRCGDGVVGVEVAGLTMRRLLHGVHPGFGVHVVDVPPGRTLSGADLLLRQHCVLVLDGRGVCRLNDQYLPVESGDVVWMAPSTQHWYSSFGQKGTRLLVYTEHDDRLALAS